MASVARFAQMAYDVVAIEVDNQSDKEDYHAEKKLRRVEAVV